jgi:hypothetical protein
MLRVCPDARRTTGVNRFPYGISWDFMGVNGMSLHFLGRNAKKAWSCRLLAVGAERTSQEREQIKNCESGL